VNPLARPEPELIEMVQAMVAEGTETLPSIGSDIADPDAKELGYDATPVAPLVSLLEAVRDLDLSKVACPLLLFNSPQDHVVDPGNSDYLAKMVSGPVERVTCERSFHVATQDYDRDLIISRSITFARRITGDGGE
jgi:carboxylesterase